MIIYAKLQSSRVRHQYGIFGGKSQTSFTRNATRAGSEEGRLFSQANNKNTGSNFPHPLACATAFFVVHTKEVSVC